MLSGYGKASTHPETEASPFLPKSFLKKCQNQTKTPQKQLNPYAAETSKFCVYPSKIRNISDAL